MWSNVLSLLAASTWFASPTHAISHNDSYPLHVSDDGRHFVTSDGEPFFWQADTAWALFHRLTIPEATKYLDDRAAKGFNVVLSVALIMFGSVLRGLIVLFAYPLDPPTLVGRAIYP